MRNNPRHHPSHLRTSQPSASPYLQQQVEAGHAPVPQVVQAVPGVVGVETFGPAAGRETAGLRTVKTVSVFLLRDFVGTGDVLQE